MKRFISIILVICVIMSFGMISASAANGTKTSCGGDGLCDDVPTIIVHGVSQSNVWLVDDNGEYVLDEDGDRINCFPLYANTGNIIKRALAPVLLTLLAQRNVGLNNALEDIVDQLFYMNISDNQGNGSKYAVLEEYPYSLAECSDYERGEIFNNVPLEGLGEDYYDHLYYFAYNSFGNNIEIVDRLYRYIEMVKEETGHSQVNIVPISLGGTVANGLLEYYSGRYEGRPNIYSSIHKMIYIVPALDGSSLVGDVYNKNISFLDKEYLYNGFLEGLMDESEARWVEIALRILPDEVIMDALETTCDALLVKVLRTCTNMWALVPSEDYDSAADMWLSDPEMSEIRRQTDMYHTAQLNSDKNIRALIDSGAQAFNIVDYDYTMYNIGSSWNTENADGIIDLDSTSMGARSANIGETLPENYKQTNSPYCSDPTHHNHISPDRVVDASTGTLPDTTFYFDDQNHESTARNDIIMALAMELIKNDNIKDVYSDPNFPQFNDGRNGTHIEDMIRDAKNVANNATDISAEDREELERLIAKGEKIYSSTINNSDETNAFLNDTDALLIKLGYREADEVKDPTVPEKISLWLLEHYGTNGFSEYPIQSIKNLYYDLRNLFKF